ncbi:AAA family ATPase [Paenibacillus bovis]|uniref:Uncharacterized protein n=1 Tax=Paenibacillus bovis TaxID=1616788 RepID=A0A172ZI95_9BACL|nr:AAA family ATPase [Paenibacillus bovis]ANF97308.1 hypothetical protein AR543_15740 [Paenibacillus bovis]
MKIKKIKVQNFRLLKSLELDLENDLSLIIGKNNCGKTSLLSILEKFVGSKADRNSFTFDDFNIEFQQELKDKIENEIEPYSNAEISLYIYIEYEENDNLSNLSSLMLDLDPDNKIIVLKFEYVLLEEYYKKLKEDYQKFDTKHSLQLNIDKDNDTNLESHKKTFFDFLRSNHKKYFVIQKKSLEYSFDLKKEKEEEYIDLIQNEIKLDKILNFQLISAKRNVSNLDSNKTLSFLSSKYYESKESKENETDEVRKFKEELSKTDVQLNKVYTTLFDNIIQKVGKFGGTKEGDSIIKIISTLQHKELLKDNTTVMYNYNDLNLLPENYNGLGYLNLISMIFELELLLSNFKRQNKENQLPADINLLFIEEPEAHTHPQMQYIFIKNIKKVLSESSTGEDDGIDFNLQTIITTHSCHITAESNFDDIKYFMKNDHGVTAKNLKDLEKEYKNDSKEEHFKFLKQYLTLHRSELFFVDKVIFVEGDTERILLPEMMRKIDCESIQNPMLSQNISIVEVGAYSHIFEKFINFIGVKSLIITDIDSAKKGNREKCRVEEGEITTNSSLEYFFGKSINEDFTKFKSFNTSERTLKRCPQTNEWLSNQIGHVLIVFQTEEQNADKKYYHARSFEDSFFHINKKFITDNLESFKSLKNKRKFKDTNVDSYDLAESCIDKKPSFAMEILLVAAAENTTWEIPHYIKEGLLWLKEN